MILITGVTASGKAKLAFDLASEIDAEIISVDSMKVYRRMDIGTAKPPIKTREKVRYHLIDIVEPSESFSLGRFLELANEAIEDIKSRGKTVIAVGGTSLYIKALLYGLFDGPASDEKTREQLRQQAETHGLEKLYHKLEKIDPDAAERIHPNDEKRVIRALEVYQLTGKPISTFQKQWPRLQNTKQDMLHKFKIIVLRRQKQIESRRINSRVKKMIDDGLVDEVKSLLAEDESLSKQARSAIGYAEIIDYLEGKTTLEDAAELIKKNTRHLAKHQRTWFKTFPVINWLDIEEYELPEHILARVKEIL